MTEPDRSQTVIIRNKQGLVSCAFYGDRPKDHGLCFYCYRLLNESEFLAGKREKLVEMLGGAYE
jgi:hypothetical protein